MVLADQVKDLFLEGNGGGNDGESYNLAHYFAAFHTMCDAIVKRGRKGFIFTIGDEAPHPTLTRAIIKQVIGDDVEADITSQDLVGVLRQHWHVFHLIVKPAYGSVVPRWKALLGEAALEVSDHEKLAEVIVSTIQVVEGADAGAVAQSWSGNTAVVVRNAIGGLTHAGASGSGPVRL